MTQPTVTIYSMSTSSICRSMLVWLDKKAINYRNVVVDMQDQGMNELATVSGNTCMVPFTIIEKAGHIEKIFGFDRRAIERALA